MAISTFTELKTAIATWCGRDDLTDVLGDFVTLAEAKLNRRLRVREMEDSDDLTPSSGTCTLPSDFLAAIRVTALTSPLRVLEYVSADALDEFYPDEASGDPNHYTIIGGSLFVRPITTSNIRLKHYSQIPALASNSTNWLLTKAPDIYLYAGLVEQALYVEDDQAAAKWATALEGTVAALERAEFGAALTSGAAKRAKVAP